MANTSPLPSRRPAPRSLPVRILRAPADVGGKPVVCHIREQTPEDNPFGDELPIVRATPATLVERLRELARDRDLRLRLGAEGRRFCELRHDPRVVARLVLDGVVALPEVAAA